MTTYRIDVEARKLTYQFTTGANGRAWKIEEGLPPGCRLTDIKWRNTMTPSVRLTFAGPDEADEPTTIQIITYFPD